MPVESSSGRGATRNATPTRFNLKERMVEGEWLDQVEALDGVPTRRTTVTIEHPKSILTRNSSPDIGFDRSIVELLLETRHPFTITTKSDRVLRDLDLLKSAADLRIASVAISVTALDPKVARTLEPRAPQPRKRLAAMKALNDAGVPCYVA